MCLWKIAWRSIQQRSLASLLTTISMALGVMLVVAVLVIYSVVHQAFHRGGEGYDLIVGPPKGSNLELVLSSVFYIGQPMTTLPYSVYQDLYESRIGAGHGARSRCRSAWATPTRTSASSAPRRTCSTKLTLLRQAEVRIRRGPELRRRTTTSTPWPGPPRPSNRLESWATSSAPPTKPAAKSDDKHGAFKVVGILKPTGTPNDNALFVNIEGFYRVGGHAGKVGQALRRTSPSEARRTASREESRSQAAERHEPSREDGPRRARRHDAIPDEPEAGQRRAGLHPRRVANPRTWRPRSTSGKEAQAAIPSEEISRLFEAIIGNIEVVLLVFAVMIVLVAGIGIMVSIYNSMNDRRHEIAIMRALGARRSTVMMVILLESILLSLGGGLLGLGMGHGLLAVAGPWIAEKVNLPLSMLQFRAAELILIPGLIALASIVGYLPAVAAYRTDVGKSLIANP